MLAFNEIYKAAATGAGAEFVDIWDGFVDEDGGYVANGPDLNGQPARLRAADGINLARPGKRKLAFYAEKPLGKLLGDAVTAPAPADPIADRRHETTPFGPMIAPLAEEAEVVIGASDLGPIDPGRPISLRSPALDGGAELLGLVAEPRHDARTPGEKLTIEGIAAAAPAGRADDFSWNPQGQTEFAAAIAPARPTTGKTPPPVLLSALAGPDTPAAPPATLETPEETVPPLPMVPGELTEATEPEGRRTAAGDRACADAVPQDDLAAVGKGRVTLEPGANATTGPPNRASPAAAPGNRTVLRPHGRGRADDPARARDRSSTCHHRDLDCRPAGAERGCGTADDAADRRKDRRAQRAAEARQGCRTACRRRRRRPSGRRRARAPWHRPPLPHRPPCHRTAPSPRSRSA